MIASPVRIPCSSRLEHSMRVVVIGGYGNFGARVCRALSGTPAMEIVAAGRHPDERRDGLADPNLPHPRPDHSARGFSPAAAPLAPPPLIHLARPVPFP